MTKQLEQAIAQARELSDSEQDAIADALFAHFTGGKPYRLSAEQAADVARIRDDLRNGRTRLATEKRGCGRRLENAGFEGPLHDRRALTRQADNANG
jgi:hypothetical protein